MRDRGVIRSWAGLGMNWLLCEFIKADSVGGKEKMKSSILTDFLDACTPLVNETYRADPWLPHDSRDKHSSMQS